MPRLSRMSPVSPPAPVLEAPFKPDLEEKTKLLAVRRALCLMIPSPGDDKAEEACLRPRQHLCRVLNRMNGLIERDEFWEQDVAFWEGEGEPSPAG
jgi:hypothetical protein